MKKKLLFIIILIAAANATLLAQQYPLFTNYLMNEYGFNPALAGSNPYLDARFTYRTQWVGIEDAPKTQLFTANGPLKDSPIGIGGMLYNDMAGQIEKTGFGVGGSYKLKIGGDSINMSTLRIGIMAGTYSFKLSENYFANNENDPNLLMGLERSWHPDLNVGIHIDLKNGIFAGVSAPRLFRRNINLNDQTPETSVMVPHYYGILGYNLRVNEKMTIQPSALLKFVETAPMQVDFSVKAIYNNKYWFGASYRSEDALAAMIGMDLSRSIFAAYAYDFTTTELNEGSRGSHEITLGLRLGMKRDKDEDGVLDKDDECPDEPGPAENNGCPEEEEEEEDPLGDKDKDGVLNKDDECPDVPGLKSNKGCPLGDRDQDGLRDDIDKCPDLAGPASNNGCPLSDRDNDGIVDQKDECPDEPGPLRLKGCPEKYADKDKGPGPSDEEKAILELAIRNLYFDTDKDVIKRSAYPYLDKLAEVMIQHEAWRLYMTGHADDRGTDEYNMDLSKRRVEAAIFYLMNRGVKRSQLITEYYGESQPVASNISESTRQYNRRVEMQFIFD